MKHPYRFYRLSLWLHRLSGKIGRAAESFVPDDQDCPWDMFQCESCGKYTMEGRHGEDCFLCTDCLSDLRFVEELE